MVTFFEAQFNPKNRAKIQEENFRHSLYWIEISGQAFCRINIK